MSVMKATFAIISCLHCPFQDMKAVQWAMDVIANMKPRPTHFINLGDLFESDAASVHPNENFHTLEDEYEEGACILESFRSVLPPTTKLIWMLGNHDDNIQIADPRRIPWKIRNLIHWNRHPDFGPEFRRWNQHPYIKAKQGTYELGPLLAYHGYDCGVTADELEGLQMAYAVGGHSHRLIVRGHTHAPVTVTQCQRTKRVKLPWWIANVGTLGPTKPPYMKRKNTELWGPAILVGECAYGSSYNPRKGVQFDAELLTP